MPALARKQKPKATHLLESHERMLKFLHHRPFTLCGAQPEGPFGGRSSVELDQLVEEDPTCGLCRYYLAHQNPEPRKSTRSRKSKVSKVSKKLHLVPPPPEQPDPYTVAKLLDAEFARIFDVNPQRCLPPHCPEPVVTYLPQDDWNAWREHRSPDTSIFGVAFLGPVTRLPPETDAQRRKRIAKALPKFKRKACGKCPPSTSTTIRPVPSNRRWHPPQPDYGQSKGYWEPFVDEKLPLYVSCPSCAHEIQLSKWWEHGCEKAITTTGPGLGDFAQLTDGAAPPEFEEDAR